MDAVFWSNGIAGRSPAAPGPAHGGSSTKGIDMIVGSMVAAAVVLAIGLASGGRGLDFTARDVKVGSGRNAGR